MDRRYSQSRFYNGTRAADSRSSRGDALVRRYLGVAKQQASSAQSYGGSTGGSQSIGGNSGLSTLAERAALSKDRGAIFKDQGSGALGARRSMWDARQLPESAGG